jgi:TRAP-type C4-dicarboxylate transport system permease small subunit
MKEIGNNLIKAGNLLISFCIICNLFLLLLVVSARYIPMLRGAGWTDELLQLFLSWLTFIGGAILFINKEFIHIDLIKNYFETKGKSIYLNIVESCVTLLFGALFLYGWLGFYNNALDLRTPILAVSRSWWYMPALIFGLIIISGSIVKCISIFRCLKRS